MWLKRTTEIHSIPSHDAFQQFPAFYLIETYINSYLMYLKHFIVIIYIHKVLLRNYSYCV